MRKFFPFALGLLLTAPGLVAQAQTAPRATPVQMDVVSPRQPYAFFPLGGTVYGDLYLQNFYDLDAAPDLLDWAGSNFTLSGETGEDAILRSVAEQDQGVPVFAALDGTVSTAVYSDLNDHNTAANAAADNSPLGNYVILDHGTGQQTGYFSLAYANPSHPDSRYAPLKVGQFVKAGTQIGLAASSGNSTGPHLHFQSSLNGLTYEPFAGLARPGPSWWVTQPSIPRSLYLEVFNMDAGNVSNPAPSSDLPRQGTFTFGATNTGCWTILHNLPANSAFRLRWLRPDGTVYQDASGSFTFPGSAAFQRTVQYYWNYTKTPGLDQTGTWHLELTVNSQIVQTAPFFVIAAGSQPVNHAPYAVTAILDPAQPTASDTIFCRVATAPGQDGAPVVVSPDSAFVYYHYQWIIAGPGPGAAHVVREVDSAGHADAIPWGLGNVGDTVSCNVTAIDSRKLAGPVGTAEAVLLGRSIIQIAAGADSAARLLWTNPAGQLSVWRADSAGNHTYQVYGPYPGYIATALAVGADNAPRLLFTTGNNKFSLDRVNSDGSLIGQLYGPYPGYTATALAVGSDNTPRLLFTTGNSQFSLVRVNADGSLTGQLYGPYPGYTATALAVGADNALRLLFKTGNSQFSLVRVNSDGSLTGQLYGPYPGYTATALAVGADNAPRVLLNKADGSCSLMRVNPDGSFTSRLYGPYPGYTPAALGVGADNTPRIVWTNINGQAALWNIDSSGNPIGYLFGL